LNNLHCFLLYNRKAAATIIRGEKARMKIGFGVCVLFAVVGMLGVGHALVSGFRSSVRVRPMRPVRLLRQGRVGSPRPAREGAGIFTSFADLLMGRKIEDEERVEVDPGEVKGTKLKILKYPNPKLRSENAAVSTFDASLQQKAKEMLLIMYASDGIGLAAPQVGINERLMVFNEFGDPAKVDKEMILVNPVILAKSEEKDVREEGCLSFPLISGKVERHTSIEVEYQVVDSGEKVRTRFQGMPARIFQHEYDHLDKVLFIDRLVPEDKAMNQKRLDKYVKKYGPGGAP